MPLERLRKLSRNISEVNLKRQAPRQLVDILEGAEGWAGAVDREDGCKEVKSVKVKIVIPVEDANDVNARLSQHFGRAPYFAAIDVDENGNVTNLEMVPNTSEHFGGRGRPPDTIIRLRPNAVITYGMGPRALNIFQNANIAVLQANSPIVKDLLDAYNSDELVELTEGCHHARHR
jgi:predicted Fe-Mo cluster-binding NifX family protein